MSKTFDQSLKDTAIISMSMLDVDDFDNTDSEEFKSLRREQQGCHNELTHREDFPFGLYTKTVNVIKGQNSYSLPNGIIKNVYIGIKPLVFVNSTLGFDSQNGTPYEYSVRSNPDKLILHPTPKDNGSMVIQYYDDRFVETTDGAFQWEITIGSTLRMPERVQHLYFDALEYYLLATHIKKQTNARWQPTMQIANERWQTFLQGSKRTDSDSYFVI